MAALGKNNFSGLSPWLFKERHNALTKKTFRLNQNEYSYFIHPYNRTWDDERSVEVPVIKNLLNHQKNKIVLELGNVLSHYTAIPHEIVDKYEHRFRGGIHNVDFMEFNPGKQYDLIISVSTLEHIGWDEIPQRPEKLLEAWLRIKNLLAPGGQAMITVPVGYNPYLDGLLKKDELRADNVSYMKRISAENEWKQVAKDEALLSDFGKPYPYANALAFLEIN